MKIGIVGCGYVGTALGQRLVAAGHNCIGTTTARTRCAAIEACGIQAAVLRLDEPQRLAASLADREALYLTMAVGRSGQAYEQVYLSGIRAVLQAAPATLRHFIYTSSTRVYGQCDGSWVDESSSTEPPSANGRILVQAEQALLDGAVARSATATVMRVGGIHGPLRDPVERVTALAGTSRDDGNVFLNLIHRDDLVQALEACLAARYHGVLNCVSDAPLTRRAYYDGLLADAGCSGVQWSDTDGPPHGKRVRNDLIKQVLRLSTSPHWPQR